MIGLPGKQDLWFLPLGGAGEIGMNLNLYGHDQQWLMVDLGVTFHDRFGIEIITPDPSFILPYKDNLKGLVLTHAHEDHIGAIPYLWPYLECPIYATPFTAKIVRQKIAEKSWAQRVKLIEIPLGGSIEIGNFTVEFITITHSTAEPNVLSIKTPLGTVVHTGDWKIDPAPLVGEPTDIERLKQLGEDGVLALVCDSTNALSEGSSGSEQQVREELSALIAQHPDQRVTVACFASNIARLETIALAAASQGRKVALVGRSLHVMTESAKETGYLSTLPPFVSEEEAASLPHNKVLLLTTGSQGEPRAALSRIANLKHAHIKMGSNDVVFFSSRIIPGNERAIGALHNRLAQSGVKIITAHQADIHVSGHPAREELKKMYQWIKPKIAVPVHGEYIHIQAHAKLASCEGIEHVFKLVNGDLIQLSGKPEMIEHVEAGRWVLDGNRLIPFDSFIIGDRYKLSTQGCIFITLGVDFSGRMTCLPYIKAFGVCESGREFEKLRSAIDRVCENISPTDLTNHKDSYSVTMRQAIRQRVNQLFGKKPLIEIHLVTQKTAGGGKR